MVVHGILEIFLRRKDASIKVLKKFQSVRIETMRDVAILETKVPADKPGRYASLVVKYRFRIIRLTLDPLQATITICTSRHYGFIPAYPISLPWLRDN